MNQRDFIEYIRTLMFWRLRLKDEGGLRPVFIPYSKVMEFIPNNTSNILADLVSSGEIEIIKIEANGKKYNTYKALKAGLITPHLLTPKGKPLTMLTKQMMNYLHNVTIPNDVEAGIYFKTFLRLKNDFMRLFFTVDNFSGRVHTPISNLKTEIRSKLLFYGSTVTSLDVCQMQPTILASILERNMGKNDFSTWINSGLDVYVMLQSKAGLTTRKEAKKRFFEILFSKPSNDLSNMFGNASWINWINDYKNQYLAQNPHSRTKPHSNLAWLLQSTEVQIMQKVWQSLINNNIPFLTVHDEIIVKHQHSTRASEIFTSVLRNEFNKFKINSTPPAQPKPEKVTGVTKVTPKTNNLVSQQHKPQVSLFELQRQWYVSMVEAEMKGEAIPEDRLKLGRCNNIEDIKSLFTTHSKVISNNPTNEMQPYLERLQVMKQVLTINTN